MPLFGHSDQALQEAQERGFTRGNQYVMKQFWLAFQELPRDSRFEFDLSTPEAITERIRELIDGLFHTRSALSWARYEAGRFERWVKELQQQLESVQAGELDRRIADLEAECDTLNKTLAACRREALANSSEYEQRLQELQQELEKCEELIVLDEIKGQEEGVRK